MLQIALKEWAVVCDLLLEGSLAIVLRKGGISEKGGAGVFELEHSRFALWPSWAHQKPLRIKEPFRDRVEVIDEPAEMPIAGIGQVNYIWQVPSREAFDQLEDLHCWTKPQIDMRFDYKPQKPLYLMAIRAYRLASPVTVTNQKQYAGCRSWLDLGASNAIDDIHVSPALDDSDFVSIIARCNTAMTC